MKGQMTNDEAVEFVNRWRFHVAEDKTYQLGKFTIHQGPLYEQQNIAGPWTRYDIFLDGVCLRSLISKPDLGDCEIALMLFRPQIKVR